MDIPTIRFKYFDKLKLYHDFLSPSSIWETQKRSYWDHEKMILLWAFSDLHGHLYSSVNKERLLKVYNLNEKGENYDNDGKNECQFFELQNKVDDDFREEMDKLKNDLRVGTEKIKFIIGNLVIKEFAIATDEMPKSPPEKIRISTKGLLLGEILYEAYVRNTKLRFKNFRIYRVSIWFLWSLILIAIATVVIFFINEIVKYSMFFYG